MVIAVGWYLTGKRLNPSHGNRTTLLKEIPCFCSFALRVATSEKLVTQYSRTFGRRFQSADYADYADTNLSQSPQGSQSWQNKWTVKILDRSKAPHRVRGHDALHRDRCEGFLRKKISSLILSLGAPSHKPLKQPYSVSSAPRVSGANGREISWTSCKSCLKFFSFGSVANSRKKWQIM